MEALKSLQCLWSMFPILNILYKTIFWFRPRGAEKRKRSKAINFQTALLEFPEEHKDASLRIFLRRECFQKRCWSTTPRRYSKHCWQRAWFLSKCLSSFDWKSRLWSCRVPCCRWKDYQSEQIPWKNAFSSHVNGKKYFPTYPVVSKSSFDFSICM